MLSSGGAVVFCYSELNKGRATDSCIACLLNVDLYTHVSFC